MCYVIKLPRLRRDGRVSYSQSSSPSSSTSTLDVLPEWPGKRQPKYFCLFHGCFFACPKRDELERHVDNAHAERANKKRKRSPSSLHGDALPAPTAQPDRQGKPELLGQAMMVQNWQQPPLHVFLERPGVKRKQSNIRHEFRENWL